MTNVVMLISFKLRNDVTSGEFLRASDKIQEDYLAKCKGYISRTLYVIDDVWTDMLIWETIDDAESAMMASHENASAVEFSSFIAEITQDVLVPLERRYS